MERLTIKAPSELIHLKDNAEMTVNTAIKKLSDYEDLEEQGKLLKPPCSVGDMTYHVSKLFGITDAIVIRIEVDSDGFWVITSSGTHSFDDFGKTVFLTREEAEAALEEMEGRKNETD